jgi:hypothetical protein
MRRIRINHKQGGKVTVTDLDTKKVLDNVLSVSFKHEPDGTPICILQVACKVEEYTLDAIINENSK